MKRSQIREFVWKWYGHTWECVLYLKQLWMTQIVKLCSTTQYSALAQLWAKQTDLLARRSLTVELLILICKKRLAPLCCVCQVVAIHKKVVALGVICTQAPLHWHRLLTTKSHILVLLWEKPVGSLCFLPECILPQFQCCSRRIFQLNTEQKWR